MSLKYIISSISNKAVCLNDYELSHYLRHNNLNKRDLYISSYCNITRAYYVEISKPYINRYKGKRNAINLKIN